MLRLVLDTNIWLDLLVFRDPGIAAMCEGPAARQAARIGEFRQMSVHAKSKTAGGTATLPLCRDPDDQKFLETALAVHADVLITKDQMLLELARRVPFRILTPATFAVLPGATDA